MVQTMVEKNGEEVVLARALNPEPTTPTPPNETSVTDNDTLLTRPAARVRVRVNDQAILDEEVRALSYQDLREADELPEPERSNRRVEIFKRALDHLIDREVVLQYAFARLKKNAKGGTQIIDRLKGMAKEQFDKKVLQPMKKGYHIDSDEELKLFLQGQGLELDILRRQFERQWMATTFLQQNVMDKVDRASGHAQVEAYYAKHPEEFQFRDSVDWQDVYLSLGKKKWTPEEAHNFADVLAVRVRRGEDFVTLCKPYDDGDSALRNGEGLGHKRGEISPPILEKTLFEMKEGDLTVVEVEGGYHVVRVVKRQHAGPMPLDEKLQKQIKDKLRNDAAEKEIKFRIQELRKLAIIDYSKEAF
jgi:hypothetical protein